MKGTEAIQGIVLSSGYDVRYAYWDTEALWTKAFSTRWSIEAFSKTSQLKFLSLPCMILPSGLNYLPRSLKVLHWVGCPLETLPLVDESYEVVEIKLQHSKIEQLWHGKKVGPFHQELY